MTRLIIACISLIFALAWFTGIALAEIDMGTVAGAWTFDEGTGDVARDSSGNCEDGKINGATWVDGKFGKALSFNGTSDYVEVPDIPDLNPEKTMSMGCWVYITGNAGQHRDIISKDGESAERQYLITSSSIDRFRAHIWTSDGVANYFDGGTPVELETWYHIAQTYDGSDLKLYVDGKEDGSISFSGDIIVTGQPVRIGGGANAGAAAYHTPGIIDEVVIFNVALEEEEVQALMNEGISSALAVSPAAKIAVCWGQVKGQY
jgi:hypothetical protein